VEVVLWEAVPVAVTDAVCVFVEDEVTV